MKVGTLVSTSERRPILVGNWKMNRTPADAVTYVETLMCGIVGDSIDIVLMPPAVCIDALTDLVGGSSVSLGAQTMHYADSGPHTGELSAAMLREIGATYVLVGHSERRRDAGETDLDVNRKVLAALAEGLTPVVCVGETEEERELGCTRHVLRYQATIALAGLSNQDVQRVIIAYEPVWAVGSGVSPNPADIEASMAALRADIAEEHGERAAAALRLLYGGSTRAHNVGALMACPNIDGSLVGAATGSVEEFIAIVHAIAISDEPIRDRGDTDGPHFHEG